MSFVYHLSLLHGVVFRAVLGLALAGLGVTIVRRSRRWWSVILPGLVVASALPAAGLAWYLGHSGTVKDHYPPTFGLWVGAPLLALGVAIAGWRSAGRWRRAVAVATVPLTVATAFLLINSHYGYWPTVGDLLGRPMNHHIDRQELTSLLAGRSRPIVHGGARPAVADPSSSRGADLAATDTLHGVLAPLDTPPGTSGFEHRQGVLYLPPAFFDRPRPRLPVIVMLGGTPGGPEAWTRGGFAVRTTDAYAAQHHGVAPILAFVDHNGSFLRDTECVDGPTGNAETFLASDTPRFLADQLHIPLDPQQWAVAGFSEGGVCAFELGVRHPDVYGTFVDFAGDRIPNLGSPALTLEKLYGGDRAAMAAHDPDNLLRSHRFRDLTGWFVAGGSDGRHVAVIHSLAAAARDAGITVSEKIIPGGHDWQFAAGAFRAALPAVADQLDTAPGPAPGPARGARNA